VVLGSFSHVAAFTIRRLSYLFGTAWRREDGREAPLPVRPVERSLIARWLLFIAVALGGLLFTRGKWVLAFGTEVLFLLFRIVVLSSAE